MNRSIAALVVIALLAGCTKQGLQIGLVSAVAIPVGGLMIAPTLDGDGPSADKYTYLGGSLLTVGVLLLPCAAIIGLDGWFHERDEAARVEATTHQADRQGQQRTEIRRRAWALTQTAETAARSGDCATVMQIEPQVIELETDFHDVVFARDVAIKTCLRERPRI